MLFPLTTRIEWDPGSNAIAPTLQSITSTITQPHSPLPTFPASFLSAPDEPWRIKGCGITETILYTSDVRNASAPGTQLLTQSINSAVTSASCEDLSTPAKHFFLSQSRCLVGGDGQGCQESPVPTGLGWWWASSSSSLNSSHAPDFLLHSVFKLFTLQQVLGSQWHLQFCSAPSHHTFISFDGLRWSVLGFSSSSDNQEPAGRNSPPAPLLIFGVLSGSSPGEMWKLVINKSFQ